jgi:hypothetical protein
MSTRSSRDAVELPAITRRDRARFVTQARRLRAAQIDKLFGSLRRGITRLGRSLVRLPAAVPRPILGGTKKA